METNVEEIKALFEALIIMGIVKVRCTDDYFSNEEFLNFTPIKERFTRERMRVLLRNLHLANNKQTKKVGEPGYDPLFKVRPIMTVLQENFKRYCVSDTKVTIDERMVAFKSFKSGIRNTCQKSQ